MKILVLAVGRLKESYLRDAEEEYAKRVRRFATLEVREVKDDAALLKAIPERARLVALDERGAQWSSEELARKLIAVEEQHGGGATLVFVIGGADGLPDELRRRASLTLAFGRITLPHRLARIILVEQIYRAFSQLRGEPYHRS